MSNDSYMMVQSQGDFEGAIFRFQLHDVSGINDYSNRPVNDAT
jgi:hypothetical protein